MARYALPFFCLIGLATTAVFADPTIYIQSGENLQLGRGEDQDKSHILSCDLTLSNGTKINLYTDPHSTQTNSRYALNKYQKCETSINRVNEKESGPWKVEATIKNGKNESVVKRYSYNVQVRKMYAKKKAVPSGKVWVYPKQLVSVRFSETFNNLSSCKLLTPKGEEYDLGSGKAENIKKLGHCGFKMVAQEEYGGTWKLVADLKNSTAFYIELQVILNDQNDLNPGALNLTFKRGEEMSISLGFRNPKPKMCYIEDPHGVKYPIQEGGCSREFGLATEYHEGQWKAYYGFEGMEKLVEKIIDVKVHEESPTFKSNIIYSNNGDINLICRVRGGSVKYCSFVRPDGEILHMTIGVGNNKYEYYGNGTYDVISSILDYESTTDCGVTIHKPDVNDFGSWRCMVKTDMNRYESSLPTIGTILKVIPPERSALVPESNTTAEDVYVKRGESYTIKCKTDNVLSYCWLRSPNGTVHNVVQEKRPKAPALKYEGEGLYFGDCSAMVESANDIHSGQWTCHMGVENGPEVEAKLNVVVTDTHLMAACDTVLLESNAETDLICQPLPGSTKVIEACRWVNPLGHGINVERDGRYVTETGSTHCKLSIRVINYEEDVGSWSCYARFANSQEEEGVAQMSVVYRSGFAVGNVVTVALCTSALVILSIAIFVLVVYKRRLSALRDLDEKVILEKPAKFP